VDHRSDPPVDRSAATGRIRIRLVLRAKPQRYVENTNSLGFMTSRVRATSLLTT
jgi:hypothetical protein